MAWSEERWSLSVEVRDGDITPYKGFLKNRFFFTLLLTFSNLLQISLPSFPHLLQNPFCVLIFIQTWIPKIRAKSPPLQVFSSLIYEIVIIFLILNSITVTKMTYFNGGLLFYFDFAGHIFHRCGWSFQKSHPSSKHRRAHKKICGTIEGYPKLIDSEVVSDDNAPVSRNRRRD
ncbi:unnamed protein product [Lactuca saligna]|uniref:Uncharacterized protein n=1 Tax=Lactuca saligna TaxID=75948 RepID=A0AA35Z246_LACSI|nr:unnamed protein product [Lactuca saligna]